MEETRRDGMIDLICFDNALRFNDVVSVCVQHWRICASIDRQLLVCCQNKTKKKMKGTMFSFHVD